jgi:hypothetical protein
MRTAQSAPRNLDPEEETVGGGKACVSTTRLQATNNFVAIPNGRAEDLGSVEDDEAFELAVSARSILAVNF